jgi:hypothetical protein
MEKRSALKMLEDAVHGEYLSSTDPVRYENLMRAKWAVSDLVRDLTTEIERLRALLDRGGIPY